MPTPLRRDEELSEDQDITVDDEDEESLAGKIFIYKCITFLKISYISYPRNQSLELE